MRLAAIDIGTNSVHMIVVRVRPDFSFEVIDREKEMVRLGAGGLDGRRLTREAMQAALQALSKFERLARSHQVDEILAAATSATREAENGGDLLAAIESQTGIRPRIITGSEEARLIHLAAVYGVDTPKPAVVIDIGGGSVEITLGAGGEVRFARSFKLGVLRLSERCVTSDPLSKRDERKMVAHIGALVDRYLGHIVAAGYDRVIGTSGTILSLGSVAAAQESGAAPDEVRNLLDLVAIKRFCVTAGIEKIDAGPKGAVIAFRGNKFAKPEKLVLFIKQQAGTMKVRPDQRLVYRRDWRDERARLRGVNTLVKSVAALVA